MRSLFLSGLMLIPTLDAAAATLTLKVTDIRKDSGHLMITVESTADGWNGKQKEAARARIKAVNGELVYRFENLPPGPYAVQVMHDENDNGKLDSNFLGIPSEGYGFSNNPRVMRRATFEEARFELPAAGSDIDVRLR
jgi:uncharacterized protein (DUF2141 family)